MRKLLSLIQYRRTYQNVQRRVEQIELQHVEQRVQERVQSLVNATL